MNAFEVTYATMKAGKSEDLIRVYYSFTRNAQKKVIVIKPSKDTRQKGVYSRNGNKLRADYAVKEDINIYDLLKDMDFDILLADEAQFFTKTQIKQLHNLYVRNGKTIKLWCLKVDYMGNPFESTMYALGLATHIRKIDWLCEYCEHDAETHLLFLDGVLCKEGNPEVIGDTEFKSVCFMCHQKFMETESTPPNMVLFDKLAKDYGLVLEDGSMTEEDVNYFLNTDPSID